MAAAKRHPPGGPAQFQEALVYSDEPEARQVFQELARARSGLSRLTFGGPGPDGPEAYRNRISKLQAEIERLETRLGRLSRAYALKKRVDRADSDQVARTLPDRTALLEFARIGMFNFQARGQDKKWAPAHYLVFVLPAGAEGRAAMVDLGPAEPIDRAVGEFKSAMADTRDIEGLAAGPAAGRIYDLVIAPLKKNWGQSMRSSFPRRKPEPDPLRGASGANGRFPDRALYLQLPGLRPGCAGIRPESLQYGQGIPHGRSGL